MDTLSKMSSIQVAESFWTRTSRFLPWLALSVSLATTFWLWHNEQRNAHQELQSVFDFRVKETNLHIEQRIASYQQVLNATAGLFTHSQRVTRQEFHGFVEWLKLPNNYPGLERLAYLPLVPAAEKTRITASLRSEGLVRFDIHPSGLRTRYAPVVYIEPRFDSGQPVFGEDRLTDPLQFAAMAAARDSNEAAITGKQALPVDAGTATDGVTMYLPLYRHGTPILTVEQRQANLAGWVAATLRMEAVMSGLLSRHSTILDFEIYDGETISPQTLMYDSDGTEFDRPDAQFQSVTTIRIAQRTWTVLARSHLAFENRIDTSHAWWIATLGTLSSFLLALFVWQLANSRARALNTARQMNSELLESRSRYQQMFDDAASIAFLVDPATGQIVDANAAAAAFWKYSLDELREMRITQINIAAPDAIHAAMHKVRDGQAQHFEWRHKLKDGTVRDVEIYSSPLTFQGKTLLYSILHDITERKMAEAALRESETRFRTLFEHSPVPYLSLDGQACISDTNDQLCAMLGFGREEILRKAFTDLLEEASRFSFDGQFDLAKRDQPIVAEMQLHRKDGAALTAMLSGRPQRNAHGDFVCLHCILVDITERRKREEAMRLSATVFDTLDEAIVITDHDNNIVTVNPAFTKITGYERDEVVGKNPHLLSSGKHAPEFYRELWTSLTATGSWHGEIWNRRKLGGLYVEQISIHTVRNEDGQLTHHVAAFSDISERKAMEEHVQHLAHYDLLTDLPNRALIHDRLRQAIVKAKRGKRRMAVMFLDLDKFKPVNDTLGHAVGDQLLKEVAGRLRHCVRESDTVARIGGDEFVVLLPEIDEVRDALTVADKIIHTIGLPYALSGQQQHISTSVGIAIYPEHGLDEEALIRHADIAMYYAKQGSDGHARVYRPEMEAQ